MMDARPALAMLALLPLAAYASVGPYVNPMYRASASGEAETFEGAVTACGAYGGLLAVPDSAAANGAVHVAAGAGGIDGPFWIAGAIKGHIGGGAVSAHSADPSAWEWKVPMAPGFVQVTYVNWAKKEPNNWGRNEKCIRAGQAGNTWNDAKCSIKLPFVCMFEPTTTTGPPTSTTTGPPTTSTTGPATTSTTGPPTSTTTAPPTTTTAPPTTVYTPNSWDYYEDTGCWYKLIDTPKNWKTASTYCPKFDTNLSPPAQLVAPISLEEAKFVAALGEVAKPRWTAGYANRNDKNFRNVGSYTPFSVYTYGGWYQNEPNAKTDETRCVAQGIARKKADKFPWLMNDADCSVQNRFVCQYCPASTTTTMAPSTTTTMAPSTTTTMAPSTTTAAPTTTPMPDRSWVLADTLPVPCWYKNFGEKADFDEALRFCQGAFKSGGIRSHLATVSSEVEARFLVDKFGGRGKPQWVGVKRDTPRCSGCTLGPWENIDGTFFSESMFYPGEPNGNFQQAQLGLNKKGADVTPWKLNDNSRTTSNRFTCEWCPADTQTSTTTPVPSTTTTGAPTSTTTGEPTSTTTGPPTTTTTGAPTSTTTAAPSTTTAIKKSTTTTTAEPPKTPCNQNLEGDMEMNVMVAHIKTIADMTESMENKKSGRINKFQPKCEEFCTGLGWGGSCAPCALSSLTSKSSCLFPGPFFTGELCHRNATSGEITDIPCCNLESATAGDYDIGKATTCVVGKQCNCKKFGNVDKKDPQGRVTQKFVASYLHQMPRVWTKREGCQAAEAPVEAAAEEAESGGL